MMIALLGTPVAIRIFVRHGVGQEIQDELSVAGHASKRGTPTMGGIVIILASLAGYLAGHLLTADPVTASGLLVLFLMTGMGLSVSSTTSSRFSGGAASGCGPGRNWPGRSWWARRSASWRCTFRIFMI